MICTIRIPDVLQGRIDSAAGDEGRSKWILDACRMRLDARVAQLAREPLEIPPQMKELLEDVQAQNATRRMTPFMKRHAGDEPHVKYSELMPTLQQHDAGHQLNPDMQALRDICAGKGLAPMYEQQSDDYLLRTANLAEVPICGKTWWEDGEHYECLMDRGHRNPKHGIGGMVRRLDD
jgi:hypothetical protein